MQTTLIAPRSIARGLPEQAPEFDDWNELNGDWNELFRYVLRYTRRVVCRLLYAGPGRNEDIDDTVQDVLTGIWISRYRIRATNLAELRAYVRAAAANRVSKLASYRTALKRDARRTLSLSSSDPSDLEELQGCEMTSEARVEDLLLAEEELGAIQSRMSKLLPRDRVLIEMHVIQGHALRTFGERFGLSDAATRMAFNRAILKLRAATRSTRGVTTRSTPSHLTRHAPASRSLRTSSPVLEGPTLSSLDPQAL